MSLVDKSWQTYTNFPTVCLSVLSLLICDIWKFGLHCYDLSYRFYFILNLSLVFEDLLRTFGIFSSLVSSAEQHAKICVQLSAQHPQIHPKINMS